MIGADRDRTKNFGHIPGQWPIIVTTLRLQNEREYQSNESLAGASVNGEPSIQVDMFEVQLDVSVPLPFRSADRDIIRSLADDGLLIGTHHDADHLDGLVPMVNDGSITIREAWLPPVANDVKRRS